VEPEPIVATVVWLCILAGATWLWWRMRQKAKELRTIVGLFLNYEDRWRILLPQVLVSIIATAVVVWWDPVGDTFVKDHAGYFQTVAQVETGILVALALTQYGESRAARAVRPPVALAVLLASIALVCAVAGATTLLPPEAHLWIFGLTVGCGIASLHSLAMVSWRLLR
jgi:cytochrome bd-type quinol oxidase subunit 2